MEIKISNGTITIKEKCNRKTRKEINKALYGDVKIVGDTSGENKFEGMNMEALDRANDISLVNMIEKIVIDGKEKPVTLETIDELDADDVDLVLDEINKITQKNLGNEKRTLSTAS